MKLTITSESGEVYDVATITELDALNLAKTVVVDGDGETTTLAEELEGAAQWCKNADAIGERCKVCRDGCACVCECTCHD